MVDSSVIGLIIKIVMVITTSWVVSEFLIRVVSAAARRAGVSQGQLRLFKEGLRSIFIILVLVIVVNLSGLTSEFTALTISGIAAIAFSLGLQTTLSNVISGILVLFDNTLRVNDLIEYGGTKGEVVKIGLRNCWIKTSEGSLVIIGNTQIANGPLINHTATQRLLANL